MAEEHPPALPTELDDWLDERAAETGRERGDVLANAVATYRIVSGAEDPAAVQPLDERIADLADRLDALSDDTDDRIEDVRDRVVQVMQVAQSRAEADHDHPGLADRVDEIEDAAVDAEEVATLRRALATLDREVTAGFDNYEAVLSSMADRADETDDKLDTLAGAVIDLRRRVTDLEAAHARREAVEELQRDANSRNVAAADCENCGKRVHVGLLSAPRCPHCREPVVDVEPGSRFFGSATLVTGDQPALAGESFEPETPEEVFAENE